MEYKANCCVRRSILEKILMVVVGLLLCLLITLFSFFLLHLHKDNRESSFQFKTVTNPTTERNEALFMTTTPSIRQGRSICMTHQCVKAASQIIDFVDPSVDPCDDFYGFVCGNFLNKSRDISEITPLSKLEAVTLNQLDALITEPISDPLPKSWELQRKYYRSCMNTIAIEEDSTNTLLNLIKKLGDWPVLYGRFWDERKFTWLNSMVQCRKLGFSYEFFLKISATDVSNGTGPILLSIAPPATLNVPFQFREPYIELVANISIELGAPPYLAKNEFTRVLQFEEAIQGAALDEDQNGEDRILPVSVLEQEFPSIPWIDFLNALTITSLPFEEKTLVHFKATRYLTNLENLILGIAKSTQANYVIWKVIETFRNYLPERLRFRYESFLRNIDPNLPFMFNRYHYCLQKAKFYFPSVAELAYVRKYLQPPKRKEIQKMVGTIKQQLMDEIKNSDWLDIESKNMSIQKLYEIEEHIGSSERAYNEDFDKVVEMEDFELDTENVIEMTTKLSVKLTDLNFRIVNRRASEVAKEVLGRLPVLQINAFYLADFNILVVPAPFLQGVMFNIQRPRYLNYGALGSVIGHELTHGFFNHGNEDQGDERWCSSETKAKYEEKIQCLLEDYQNYTEHLSEFTKNAKLALEENTADLFGPELAYETYQAWTRENGQEPTLPSLNYTQNQLFWIISGAFKCYQPKQNQKYTFDQHHGVPSFAVTFSMRNSLSFASDFNCPIGSNMNPEKKCRIL